jgi:hypothetical protein
MVRLLPLYGIKCQTDVKWEERGETTAVLKFNLTSRRENPLLDCKIISDYLHLLTESKMLP